MVDLKICSTARKYKIVSPDRSSIGVLVSIMFFRPLEGGLKGTIVGTLIIPAVMFTKYFLIKKKNKIQCNILYFKTKTKIPAILPFSVLV